MVTAMRVEYTGYAVSGWGEGELWMRNGVVLAHEFSFRANAGDGDEAGGGQGDSGAGSTRPPEGVHEPPTGTLAGKSSRVGNGFVPKVQQPATTVLEPSALVQRFNAFFAGEDSDFGDVPLDLDGSTPFQQAVAAALRALPRGEVASYGEVAALAGYPGAARAVGTYCAHNRFMFLVPCHRVVGANGLGGYGSAGLGVKRRLLALEGVAL
jgi:O-6-methylguanine DNA methyltransferase